jgi:hypothetical protein
MIMSRSILAGLALAALAGLAAQSSVAQPADDQRIAYSTDRSIDTGPAAPGPTNPRGPST